MTYSGVDFAVQRRRMTLSFDVVPSEHPTMSKLPMTGTGHAALEEELRHRTRVERMRVIERIQDAIADEPDIAESSEYQTAN